MDRVMSVFKLVTVLVMLPACAGLVLAQKAGRPNTRPGGSTDDQFTTGSIRGRVLMPEGAPYQGSARITLQSMDGGQYTVFTDYQGQFNFSGLTPAYYAVEVDADRERFEPVSQSVQVYRGMPSVVNLSLKYKSKGDSHSPMPEATISVTELDKSIPEKARKEFRRGTEAAQAGKTEEAIGHFHKAAELYPDFIMARNDLGVQLMLASRLEEATEQLRAAVKIDPKAFNPQLNLGIALVRQQQFAEAGQVLAKAVSLNPRSAAAHLYAGQAFAAASDADRAEKEFKSAYTLGGRDYVVALFYLGNLYIDRGEREKAVQSFMAYLAAAPDAANAAEARKLVGILR
jgi:tetratricopeptide (TPR) repeat protein